MPPTSAAESRPRSPMLADTYLRSGKVRDLYSLPDGRLALVASDRISAFDVVLPTEIPDKGRVLTGLSRFWFAETAGLVPNHLLSTRNGRPCPPRPDHDLPPGGRDPGRGGRPRLSGGLGLEGISRWGRDLRDPSAGRTARKRSAARADLHAGDQGGARRPRREHRLRDDGRAGGPPDGRTRS